MIGLLLLFVVAYLVLMLLLAMICASAAFSPPRRATGWALAHGEPSTPLERDIPFEEWTLQRPNAQLCVWDVPGHDSEGSAVVLLHGWSRSKLTWLERLDWWQARTRRILIPDLRGHGDSTPDGATMGLQDAADIQALVEESGESAVVLVGRSLGSVIAIHAAQQLAESKPGAVKGIIAVAPYEKFSQTLHARLAQRRLPGTPTVPIAMAILKMRGVHTGPTSAAAGRIKAPLLVIHGVLDPISAIEDARRIVSAANGEMIEVQGAAHGDHWDHEKERLDEAVESFLTRVMHGVGSETEPKVNQPAS